PLVKGTACTPPKTTPAQTTPTTATPACSCSPEPVRRRACGLACHCTTWPLPWNPCWTLSHRPVTAPRRVFWSEQACFLSSKGGTPMAKPDRSSSPGQRWLGLAIVLAAVLVDLIDVGVVVIAAPHLAASLGASPAELQWIVASYALAFGVLLVLGGRLGDILGRRRTFLAGTVVFTIASAACAFAPDTTTLIAARAVAGLGAAFMVPQVLSIIQTTFTESERPRAFGAYGRGGAVRRGPCPPLGGVAVGPGPGGVALAILVPVHRPVRGLAVIGGARFLEESREDARPGLDLVGTVTVGTALLLVLFPLVALGHGSVSPPAMVGGLVCLVLLAVFVRAQRRREQLGRSVLAPMP